MIPTSRAFKASVRKALADPQLQAALRSSGQRFVEARRSALAELPEFEDLRSAARAIRNHAFAHLDDYLTQFEQRLQANGGQLHWAVDAASARAIIARICRAAGAGLVIKGKSMVAEEIGLNESLTAAGCETIETDLGEYIIQLAGEPPSHIIAPAVHKSRQQIADLFRHEHDQFRPERSLDEVGQIVDEARDVLRKKFLQGDVGITGANFLIAETGSAVIVTNEGNGDLTGTLPPVHIVLASIDKVVPTLEDVSVLLRLLARSATGQAFTAYTTFFTGARRDGDPDGPETVHVVLLDNGRSMLLDGPFRDMLRCIRCGACLNHCPVYSAVGGHAYGWVYPGPMGSVLTPLLLGLEEAGDLPDASTLCGRCEEVCPMSIPLPGLLREHRRRAMTEKLKPARERWALALWAYLAGHPRLYRLVTTAAARLMGRIGRRRGHISRLPLAGAWTAARDLPAPAGITFHRAWERRRSASA